MTAPVKPDLEVVLDSLAEALESCCGHALESSHWELSYATRQNKALVIRLHDTDTGAAADLTLCHTSFGLVDS